MAVRFEVVGAGEGLERRVAGSVHVRAPGAADIDPRHPVRIGHVRRRAQQQPVEHVDHDHRRSNPDREDERRAEREEWSRSEPPQPLTNVRDYLSHCCSVDESSGELDGWDPDH